MALYSLVLWFNNGIEKRKGTAILGAIEPVNELEARGGRMYFSEGNPDGVGEVPPEYFDRDKFLVYIGPSERGYGSDIIRLPKGSWVVDAAGGAVALRDAVSFGIEYLYRGRVVVL